MHPAPALIDDATVARLLSPSDVLGVIRQAFVGPPAAPPRLAVGIDDGIGQSRRLLVMPALRRRGLATIKLVSVPRGDVTVFKSVGHAAEDLVVTELLMERMGLVNEPPDVASQAHHDV